MLVKTDLKVNNLPSYALDHKYIVARVADTELWFWGAFDSYETATKAALEINGVIVEEG